MPKGYKLPKSSASKATMRADKPKTTALKSPASSGMPSIPSVRPVSMRNLPPRKGFNPGKY